MSLLLLVGFLLSYCMGQTVYGANAVLTPVDPSISNFSAIVRFSQVDENTTTVHLSVSGLTINPNRNHSLIITQFGDLRGLVSTGFNGTPGVDVAGSKSLGSHFDPLTTNQHGCPPGTPRHAGDLGNWLATAGSIEIDVNITGIELSGGNSIIGRGIVLFEDQDDCVSGPTTAYAVGVIGIAKIGNTTTNNASGSTGTQLGVCVLQGTSNCNSSVASCGFGAGIVTFEQINAQGDLLVRAQLNNWRTGSGIHVHQFGDIVHPGGAYAGPHYNRNGALHGLPTVNLVRHTGDMGYMFVSGNASFVDFVFDSSNTDASNEMILSNLIGHSVIVHASVDHGQNGTGCVNPELNGASGAMMFQCVIGIANSADQTVAANALPKPRSVSLSNNFAGSACVANVPTVSFVVADLDCVHGRSTHSLKNNVNICQPGPNGFYYRLQCSPTLTLQNSFICNTSNCRAASCLPLTGQPGICNADGYGHSYAYECKATNLFFEFSVLVSLISLWILATL